MACISALVVTSPRATRIALPKQSHKQAWAPRGVMSPPPSSSVSRKSSTTRGVPRQRRGDKQWFLKIEIHQKVLKSKIFTFIFVLVTPLIIFLYTPYNKHVTKWLFWNCQKPYKRSIMPTNFWSFVYVIAKGSWAKVGSDISTSLEELSFQG